MSHLNAYYNRINSLMDSWLGSYERPRIPYPYRVVYPFYYRSERVPNQNIKHFSRNIPLDFADYVKIEKQVFSNGYKYYILTDLKANDETYRFESDSYDLVLEEAFEIYDTYKDKEDENSNKETKQAKLVKTEDVTLGDISS